MPTRFFKVQEEGFGNVLVGLHEDDHVWLQKQKPGKQFKTEMKTTRNPDHHRKGFALLKLVMDNHPTYTNIDDVLVEFKLRSGHYVEHIRAGNSAVANQLRQAIQPIAAQTNMNHVYALIDQLEREAKLVYMPKSIAFDNMGQEEFEEIYEKWIDVAVWHFSQRGDSDQQLADIRRQIAEF